jgi:hypothetical protein
MLPATAAPVAPLDGDVDETVGGSVSAGGVPPTGVFMSAWIWVALSTLA